MRAYALAMFGNFFNDERHCVLIKVKVSRASAHAVTFGQCLEHLIGGLLIGVKGDKNAIVARAELIATFPTAIKRYVIWSVRTYQLEILSHSLALVQASQRASLFQNLP
jgi:hypothetical protein